MEPNDEYEDDYYCNNKYQSQAQINKQTQQMYLDYKDVSDTLLSLLSTAEVMALQDSNKKEFGYYDEYDTAKRKNKNSQTIQLLRLLRQFNGMRKDFVKLYKGFELPDKLTLDSISKKISYWKSYLGKDKTLGLYFDEIINILKDHPTININLELNKYYNKTKKLTEEEQAKRWDNVIGVSHLCMEEDKEVIDEILRTGKYSYEVKYNRKAGRNVAYLVNRENNGHFIELY